MAFDPAALGISRSRTFRPELESVRGIAVVLVVVMHIDAFVVPPDRIGVLSPLRALLRSDRLGVDLFFVLSAFLLSGPILEARAGGAPVNIREFLVRRALRILPLYWTAVIVGTSLWRPTIEQLPKILPYFVFLNLIPVLVVPMQPYSNVWWSLATEVHFYALLALSAWVVRFRRGGIVILMVLAVYFIAYGAWIAGLWHASNVPAAYAIEGSVFGRGPLLLAGIIAAEAHRRWAGRVGPALARRSWLRHGGADLVLFLLIGSLAAHLQYLSTLSLSVLYDPRSQHRDIVEGVLLATTLLWLMVAPIRLRSLFVNPVLGRLGVLSYSIYLLHLPLFMWFLRLSMRAIPGMGRFWGGRQLALVSLYAVVLVALASCTFRWIEQPFLRRKARL